MMVGSILKNLAFRFTGKLAGHPLFNQYFQNVDDFVELTGLEEQELDQLFELSDDELFERFASVGRKIYSEFQPPFIDVANFLDYATREIITAIHKRQLEVNPERVTLLNQLMQNAIAKSYYYESLGEIKKTVSKTHEESNSPLAIHYRWLENVADYLLSGHKDLPETDHLACDFAHWLKSMEYEMYLASVAEEKEHYRAQVFLSHRRIHQQFSYILAFVKAEDYALAYSHLTILYRSVLELTQYIRALQLNYVKNESRNFYLYIENKSVEEEQLYYFVTIQITKWEHISLGTLVPRESVYLRGRIETRIKAAGLEGVILLTEDEVRVFIHNEKNDIEHRVVSFLQDELHPLLEEYAANKGMKIRTIGVNLDNLNAYPQHKIAMLQRLPRLPGENNFTLVSESDVELLYAETIEAEKVAKYAADALDKRSMEVFFQPIITTAVGEKIYVEALVRAPSDDGYIAADEFISYLEREDKMLDLDLFVINKIKQYLPELNAVVASLSLNIYPTSFKDKKVLQALIELSNECKAYDMSLIVEITEQLFLADTDNVETLALEHGIAFSLDDFGSGYSNLLQLIDLTERGVIHVLKIDGSLVKRIDTDEKVFKVIEIITQIASTLGVTPIVMEYVHNEKIFNELEKLEANIYYQGFYFDKPLDIHNLKDKYRLH